MKDYNRNDLLNLLKDIELLIRVNAPITDGSPMHKTIKHVLSKEETHD